MTKLKVSFVQYAGLSNRSLIDLAIALNKQRFEVNYFWCHPGIDLYSTFQHVEVSEAEAQDTVNRLRLGGVHPIQFSVATRFIPDPTLPWIETDFFEHFNSTEHDVVFTWRSGRTEFPFMYINVPIVEWNVFGMVDRSDNLIKSLAISPLVRDLYLKNGGDQAKSDVMYVPVDHPSCSDNLREALGIRKDVTICGMHQRPEDGIFSSISLDAVAAVAKKTGIDLHFLMLGGSKKYQEHAGRIGLKNFRQLDYTPSADGVSRFLNTLNIYTHSRADGETLGRVLQEAMIHRLPVISHKAQWNAHVETIGTGGVVADTFQEYVDTLSKWVMDSSIARQIGERGYEIAVKRYTWSQTVYRFEQMLENILLSSSSITSRCREPAAKVEYSVNYFFLIRYFSIMLLNRICRLFLGRFGPPFVLWLQQSFNRVAHK